MTFISSLCVYCGSSDGLPSHRAAAERLGTLLGRRRVRLVYGGGMVGLMGVCANAALTAGGKVVGIIPRHLDDREIGHRGLDELIVCESMHVRKQRMFEMSDAVAVLPGGYGTLDEAFEIITWRQLGLHDKPIVLVNVDGYWNPLLALLDHVIEQGYAQPHSRRLYTVVSSVEAIFDILALTPPPKVESKEELM